MKDRITRAYIAYGKRIMDVVVSSLALGLLAPFLLLLAVLVWWMLGPPILFRQQRPGYLTKRFNLVKFRTMPETRDATGRLLPDCQRLTWFGSLLRRSSVDELPELWNVLKGEMSLVGPRPLLPEYLPYYSITESRRHNVRPGLTGLAQVSGRNCLSWDDRLALDALYVDRLSLGLDMWIIYRTFGAILSARGVSAVSSHAEGNLAEIRKQSTG